MVFHTNEQPAPKAPVIRLNPVTASLFSDVARQAAEACPSKRNDQNKTTQLRRFYDELVMWHDKVFSAKTLEEQQKNLYKYLPYIQMLRAKVAYAKGRDLVDMNFYELFDNLIKQITTLETLKTARLFFEAFLGYKKFNEK